MFITKCKDRDVLKSLLEGSVMILSCHGCKEIGFPEEEAKALCAELEAEGRVVGSFTTDYLCNPENLRLRLRGRMAEITEADTVLVFSCGVGVQTVSDFLADQRVIAACDTVALPGAAGVTPLEFDCGQCGECFLNVTGGICPITACSKSLVNGPCGGAKNGKCEICPEMDCGWDRILQRLKAQGRLSLLRGAVQLHDFSTEEATGKARQTDRSGGGKL